MKFRFFHTVEKLRLDGEGKRIAAIEGIEELADQGAYQPLVAVTGADGRAMPCWRSAAPDSLPRSPKRRVLAEGKDFDVAVLAIPVGALGGGMCDELAAAHPPFASMLEKLETMPTQAMQLWLDCPLADLGWADGPSMVISYRRPFNSWVDMFQLLARESWPDGTVRTIGYFADALLESDRPTAREGASQWMEAHARGLWPGFRWQRLHDPEGRSGSARLDYHYFSTNTDPSARYVLAVKGSSKHRLDPDESGFENLGLAGDWVRTPWNSGCLEGAATGGLGAARGIIEGRIAAREKHFPGKYVECDGDWVRHPPAKIENAKMFAFILKADPARLQALCDHLVNEPCGRRLRVAPLAPGFAVLVCANIEKVRSESVLDGDNLRGFFPENDVAIFVPVRRELDGETRSAALVPYLFVDNMAGMIGGREVYGFPKLFAEIDPPPGLDGPLEFECRSLVARAADADQKVERDVVIAARPQGHVTRIGLPNLLAEAMEAVVEKVFEALDATFEDGVDFHEIPLVFLKQFRDAADTRRACDQGIVQCNVEIESFRPGAIFHGDFDVRLPWYYSLRIEETLGIREPAKIALSLEVDFRLPHGENLWKLR